MSAKINKFKLEYTKDIFKILKKAYANNSLTLGEYNQKLKILLQNKLKYNYAETTINGFSALHLSIESLLRKKKIHKILIPEVSSCFSALYAIKASRNEPVFAPINNFNGNLQIEYLKKKIKKKKIDLIISPNLFGIKNKLEELIDLKVPIIEDCAQSFLSSTKNNNPLADIQIYSFYPTKGFQSIDGGAILYKDKKYKKFFENKIYYGGQKKEVNYNCYNYKMSNICAYLAYNEVKKHRTYEIKFNNIKKKYDKYLTNKNIKLLKVSQDEILSKYIIMFDKISLLNKIKTMINNKVEINTELMRINNSNLKSQSSDYIMKRNLSLPYYLSLTEKKIKTISKIIISAISQ